MRVFPTGAKLAFSHSLRFSADGRWLAFVDGTGCDIVLADLPAGEVRRLPNPFGHSTIDLEFSADGSRLVIPSQATRLRLIDPISGAPVGDLPAAGPPFGLLRLPGTDTLIYQHETASGSVIGRTDLQTGTEGPPVGKAAERPAVHMSATADGRLLAAGTMKGRDLRTVIRLWPVGPKLAARPQAVLPLPTGRGGRQFIQAAALSGDGSMLVAAQQTSAFVMDVADPDNVRRFGDTATAGEAAAFHPSRPLVLTSGTSGTVALWDATNGARVRALDWKVGVVQAVAFAPDGLTAAAVGNGKMVVWDVD